MKRAILIFLLTINYFHSYSQPDDCFPNLPDTIYHCGLVMEIPVFVPFGEWYAECPEGLYLSTTDPVNNTYIFEFSGCGEYLIVYTELECGTDSLVIQVDNPSSTNYSTQNISDLAYGSVSCPGGGASCSNSISISGGGAAPSPEWSICTELNCNYELISADTVSAFGICWSGDIVFDTLSGAGNTTMCWEGDQFAFLEIDSTGIITNNYFDFIDSLNGDLLNLGLCPLPDEFCSFDNCEPDSISHDTSYILFPVHLGGQWHLIEDMDTIAMEQYTAFDRDSNTYLLEIDPSADYFGPNNIIFTLYELIGSDTVATNESIELVVWWKELYILDSIQRINTINHYGDTTICLTCGGAFFSTNYGGIPSIPEQPCGPITLSFGDDCACSQDNFVISGDPIIDCINDCTDLTVSFNSGAHTSLIWNTGEVSSTITVCSPGNYWASSVDTLGCELFADFLVFMDDFVPPIHLEYEYVIGCDDPCVIIDVAPEGSTEVQFILPDGSIVYDNVVSVCEEGIVSVTVLNLFNGCEAYYTTSVVKKQEPPYIELPATYELHCSEIELTPIIQENNLTFEWEGPAGSQFNNNLMTINVSIPGIYTVTTTNQYGCESATSTEIFEIEELVVAIDDIVNCTDNDKSASITTEIISGGISPFSYSLDNVNYQNESSFDNLSNGNYTLYIKHADNCVDEFEFTINFSEFNNLSISVLNDLSCTTPCTELISNIDQSDNTITSISWFKDGILMSNNSSFETCESGIYQLIAEDISGCILEENYELKAFTTAPNIQLESSAVINCDDYFPEVLIIDSNPGTLNYLWTGPSINANNETAQSPAINIEGIYSLLVTDSYGCTALKTVEVEKTDEILSEFEILPTCANEAEGSITILEIQGGVPPYSVFLDNVEYDINQSIVNLEAGNYTLEIVDAEDCSISYDAEIDKIPFTDLQFEVQEEYDLCFGNVEFNFQNLIEQSSHFENIEWNDGATGLNRVISESGEYSFSIITNCNIIERSFRVVNSKIEEDKLFYIPNIFTPNNDGLNDRFEISSPHTVENFKVDVFDRWGSLVYRSTDLNDSWDGQVQSAIGKQGVYTYILEASIHNCSNEKQRYYKVGDITILK